MMMGNMGEIATLTDKLALMPDQMLPRLAQQYKGDAITLSLILGEKNRRDRLRNAPKMAAQAMPKVNDEVVASMQLPEETGIGALPAPNMANMADGGITGYDLNPDSDGGLAYANEPVLRMAGGGVARFNGQESSLVTDVQRILQKSPYERTAEENALLEQAGYTLQRQSVPSDSGVGRVNTYLQNLGPNLRNYFTGGASKLSDAELAARPNAGGVLSERILRGMGVNPSATRTANAPEAAPDMGNEGRRTSMAGITAAAPAAPTAGATPTGGLGDLAPKAAPAPAAPNMGKVKEQYLKDVGKFAPETESATDYMERRKTMLGDEGKSFSKYEEKLLAQEAAAPGEKDQAFWMAVTQAGLAAAAGASPHALKNIAEGFGTGLAGYKESLKEFKKAEQERTKALADIEQARRAEKRGDVDAALAFEAKSQERMDKHNDRVSAGLASLAGAEISGQYHLAGQQITASAYNRTPAEIQLVERIMAEKKIPFSQALQEVMSTKREPVSTEKLRADWLDPMKRAQIQQDYPNVKTFDDYALVMGGGSGGGGGMRLVGSRPGP